MEHIKEIMCIVAEEAYEQLKHNKDKVDTHELGEVVDMVKDMAEACYYCSVVEAMEDANKEKEEYESRRYYTPHWEKDKAWEPYIDPYMDTARREGTWLDRPHDYKEPVARDLREGRSPLTRRMYMESKEHHEGKEVQLQELEKYMGELSQDVTEMIGGASPEEKMMLHKKLAALTNKVEQLVNNPNV